MYYVAMKNHASSTFLNEKIIACLLTITYLYMCIESKVLAMRNLKQDIYNMIILN